MLCRVAHDNALRDSSYAVVLRISSSIEQMVGGLLERCQHQNTIFHLCYTEPRDTENLTLRNVVRNGPHLKDQISIHLVGHNVAKQHDMSWVNIHPVALHRVLDLSYDSLACGLDSKNLLHLHDVIGCCLLSDNTYIIKGLQGSDGQG